MTAAPDDGAHGVAPGRQVTVGGLEVAHMVRVAEDFTSLPTPRICPDCVKAMEPHA